MHRSAEIKSWVVLSTLPKCQVEAGRGIAPEASLTRFIQAELMPAMRESGIILPSDQPNIVYADDDDYKDENTWSDRFNHVLVKGFTKFRKPLDLVLVLLAQDKNCKWGCLWAWEQKQAWWLCCWLGMGASVPDGCMRV